MLPNVPDINADIEMDRNLMRPLQGHGADVFIVSWNPKCDYFASGSGDSTARLWNGEDLRGEINSVVLFHESQKLPTDDEQKNKDVTSIHWNVCYCIVVIMQCSCFRLLEIFWPLDVMMDTLDFGIPAEI